MARKTKPPCYDENGKQICGAKRKPGPNGEPRSCRRPPMKGKNRCHRHGGKIPGGYASHKFKHGMYSTYLPPRLRETFDAAMNDEQLRSMTAETALANARLIELVQRLNTGETSTAWAALRAAWQELDTARQAGDAAAMATAINTVGEIINRGGDTEEVWREIQDTASHKRDMHDAETKRQQALHQMLTSDRAMAMFQAVVTCIRNRVKDQRILSELANDLALLWDHQSPKRVHGEGG